MSQDFSEILALGCPDLATSNDGSGKVLIMNTERRLSIKQMTATELAAARVAAAAEIKAALAKVALNTGSSIGNEQLTPSVSPAMQINSSYSHSTNFDDDDTDDLKDKGQLLPAAAAPRDRIISLPNIHEQQLLAVDVTTGTAHDSTAPQPQLELVHSLNDLNVLQRSTSKISENDNDYEAAQSSSLADSIEQLRMRRLERSNERERSISAVSRAHHERSAAPNRLHSSSISSIGSVSLNASKNASRRGSTASNAGELLPTATLPCKSISTSHATTNAFPLAKTTSAPNMERRRSSLATLFPGASPLVAPEPILHVEPKIAHTQFPATNQQTHADDEQRDIPAGKMVHRTKTPPPVGVKLGVSLKKVSPPKTQISVKKNVEPMLGVVLRKVERKVVPQKSILDDDEPLYHLTIVRSGGESKDVKPTQPKPKPKPALHKSATTAAITAKPNPGGILTGPQGNVSRAVNHPVYPLATKPQRPQIGVPITIQKIEGDKIIIIKKIIVPKNSKIPEQYLKVGPMCSLFV